MNDKTVSSEQETRYWFPAKTYGWGWGLPATWEGWLTFLAFIAICSLAHWLAAGSIIKTALIVATASAVLIAIAFWKGEPPRWRWGK